MEPMTDKPETAKEQQRDRRSQIDKLGDYIMRHFPHQISVDEGAADVAIRIMEGFRLGIGEGLDKTRGDTPDELRQQSRDRMAHDDEVRFRRDALVSILERIRDKLTRHIDHHIKMTTERYQPNVDKRSAQLAVWQHEREYIVEYLNDAIEQTHRETDRFLGGTSSSTIQSIDELVSFLEKAFGFR